MLGTETGTSGHEMEDEGVTNVVEPAGSLSLNKTGKTAISKLLKRWLLRASLLTSASEI